MALISEDFKPLYTSKKRYFLITGGRASLKSTSVHDFVARLTFESGHGILFTRYTMTSAHKSIIPEFVTTLERLNIKNAFYITKNKITNIQTGSFIYFSGIKTSSIDHTGNLKSLAGITTWIIEEGEDFDDEKSFNIIDDSIRSTEQQNRIIWIQNPTTKEHFIYKKWIEPKSKELDYKGHKITLSNLKEVEHIHTTYHLAEKLGYLSDGWIEKANKNKINNPSHYYYNYIGGWLEKAEGVIYSEWQRGKWDPSLNWCYGLDFGFHPDPTAMLKVAIDKKNKIIYIQESLFKKELSTDGMVIELKKIADRKDLIIADNSEKRLIHDLREKDFNIYPCVKGAGSIKKGIKDILSFKLIVCGESDNLVKELNNYAWNDRKSGIPLQNGYDHLLDGMRYAFDRLNRKTLFVG